MKKETNNSSSKTSPVELESCIELQFLVDLSTQLTLMSSSLKGESPDPTSMTSTVTL